MTEPDFDKGQGLVPAVVQDAATGEVLMMAYMNRLAWQKTLETGIATYWSRSRNALWVKGETSGNIQKVHAVFIDCDNDTVLLKVEQAGGAACHTIYRPLLPPHFRGVKKLVGERVFNPDRGLPMSILKSGSPKERLETSTIDLFRKAGWRITCDSRSYFPTSTDDEISCSLVRAQEMSRYVESGVLDLGLTGRDWILENESDVVVAENLVLFKGHGPPGPMGAGRPEDSP